MSKSKCIVLGLFLAACNSAGITPVDSEGDLSQAALSDSSALARPALRFIEETNDEADLTAVGISKADAKVIMSHRRGDDGVLDTVDDDPFQTIRELSSVLGKKTRSTTLKKLAAVANKRTDLVDSACEADHARRADLPLFTTPGQGFAPAKDLIDAAELSIDLTMYQLSAPTLITALTDASARGVDVRVLLDRAQPENAKLVSTLGAAGIDAKLTSTRFIYTHEKSMTVDGERTLVFSGNFDDASFNSGRNYGSVTTNPEDVWDMEDLFQADFDDTPMTMSCTRLVLSPDNSRSRIVDLVDAAQTSLDMEAMYASDTAVLGAIERAKARGVAVRVLFNDPKFHVGDATPEAKRLKKAGIPVRRLPSRFIHAKVLMVDQREMFLGSENFSSNSLTRNREVGLRLHFSATAEALASSTFSGDWNAAVTF